MLNQLDPRKIICTLLFISHSAHATWSTGAYIGFGGAGISTTREFSGQEVAVNRSESPGVYGISVEYDLSPNSSIAFDHTSGFKLAPFSAGVDFDGFTYRYYYPGEKPGVKISKTNDTTLLIKKFEPWVGGSMGIARGTILRKGDVVADVDASGVYIGGRFGVDYQVRPSVVWRSEMIFGMSMPSSGIIKDKLSEFGLVTGLYYIW